MTRMERLLICLFLIAFGLISSVYAGNGEIIYNQSLDDDQSGAFLNTGRVYEGTNFTVTSTANGVSSIAIKMNKDDPSGAGNLTFAVFRANSSGGVGQYIASANVSYNIASLPTFSGSCGNLGVWVNLTFNQSGAGMVNLTKSDGTTNTQYWVMVTNYTGVDFTNDRLDVCRTSGASVGGRQLWLAGSDRVFSFNSAGAATMQIYNTTLVETTTDTSAPGLVSLTNTSASNVSLSFNFVTNETTNSSLLIYNSSTRNTASLIQSYFNTSFYISQNVTFVGLLPSTTYFLNLTVWDTSGNFAWNDTFSVNTSSNPPPDLSAPGLIIFTNLSATNSSFLFNWLTNESSNASLKLFNSSTRNTASLVTTYSNTTYSTNHTATINGLKSNTFYFLNLTFWDNLGNFNYNDSMNFSTSVSQAETFAGHGEVIYNQSFSNDYTGLFVNTAHAYESSNFSVTTPGKNLKNAIMKILREDAAASGYMKFGLYSSNSSGSPGTLIAWTENVYDISTLPLRGSGTCNTVSGGLVNLSFANPIPLNPGTSYWLAVTNDTGVDIVNDRLDPCRDNTATGYEMWTAPPSAAFEFNSFSRAYLILYNDTGVPSIPSTPFSIQSYTVSNITNISATVRVVTNNISNYSLSISNQSGLVKINISDTLGLTFNVTYTTLKNSTLYNLSLTTCLSNGTCLSNNTVSFTTSANFEDPAPLNYTWQTDPQLILWWNATECSGNNLTDSSGHNYNGYPFLSGNFEWNSTQIPPNRTTKCSIKTNTVYPQFGENSFYLDQHQNATICSWFRPDHGFMQAGANASCTAGTDCTQIMFRAEGSQNYVLVNDYWDLDTPGFEPGDGNLYRADLNTSWVQNVIPQEWSFICAMRSPTNRGRIYVNGVNIWNATTGSFASMSAKDPGFGLGGHLTGKQERFKGMVSTLVMIDRNLNTSEVQAIYNSYIFYNNSNLAQFVYPTPVSGGSNNSQVIINISTFTTQMLLWFGDTANLGDSHIVQNASLLEFGYSNWTTNVTAEGTYYYKASGDNVSTNTSLRTWVYDVTPPSIVISRDNAFNVTNNTKNPYNSSQFLNITVSDLNNIKKFSINFTELTTNTSYYSYVNSTLDHQSFNFNRTISTIIWPNGFYKVKVMAWDSNNLNSSDYLMQKIGLVLDSVSIVPGAPYTEDNLTGVCKATESTGNNITMNWRWYLNGALVANDSLKNVVSGEDTQIARINELNTTFGQTWIFSCEATRDLATSSWYNSTPALISPYSVDTCTIATNKSINFNFKNLNGSNQRVNISSTINYIRTNATGGSYSNFSFTNNSIYTFPYCISPGDVQVYGNIRIQYSDGQSIYSYVTNGTILNRTVKNVDIYIDGETAVTAIVSDNNNNRVADAYILVERYDYGSGNYILTGIYATNFEGTARMYLTLNSAYYRFVLYYPYNNLRQTTSPTYITSNTIEFTINLFEDVAQDFFDLYSVNGRLRYNNDTNSFRFEYSDPSLSIENAELEVYRLDSRGEELINTTSLSTVSGTLLMNIEPVNGSTYRARAYITKNGIRQLFDTLSHTFLAQNVLGHLGLYGVMLFTIIFAFAFTFSIPIGVIMTPIPSIIFSAMGWINIETWITVMLELVAIVLAVIINNRG